MAHDLHYKENILKRSSLPCKKRSGDGATGPLRVDFYTPDGNFGQIFGLMIYDNHPCRRNVNTDSADGELGPEGSNHLLVKSIVLPSQVQIGETHTMLIQSTHIKNSSFSRSAAKVPRSS